MAEAKLQDQALAAVRAIQDEICAGLEALERDHGTRATFAEDRWERAGGGGGWTRVLADGGLFEKGGVNVSAVHGALEPDFAAKLPGSGRSFYATGVSLVLHPRSPHIPTVHANFRYIEHGDKQWFGGGADLTPYYYDPEDEAHFHKVWREHCEAHADVADYEKFRAWCDRYFYLPHRGEHRGVGGIFYDNLWTEDDGLDRREAGLAFTRDSGRRFLEAYRPIVERHASTPVSESERHWQEIRRGRYAEFNLVYDRGTTFGLKTGGRTESILMSLPPRVRWEYAHEPAPGSPEAALLERVRREPPGSP